MLKSGLTPFDPREGSQDHARLFESVMGCLAEGDHESAQEILVFGLKYMNRMRVVKRYHIPRRTLYNLISFKSVPTLELVAKVCYALKQEAALAGKRQAESIKVDSAEKNGRISSHGRKALPVGAHPRL